MIEVIIVMVILTILAVTAVTKLNVSTRKLDTVARQLRSDLQYAQDIAMTNSMITGFRSINSTVYEIYSGGPGQPLENPLTGNDFIVNISPAQFFGVVPTVSFQTSGVPNIAANATIVLTESGGQRTLTVEQNTGYVGMTSP